MVLGPCRHLKAEALEIVRTVDIGHLHLLTSVHRIHAHQHTDQAVQDRGHEDAEPPLVPCAHGGLELGDATEPAFAPRKSVTREPQPDRNQDSGE